MYRLRKIAPSPVGSDRVRQPKLATSNPVLTLAFLRYVQQSSWVGYHLDFCAWSGRSRHREKSTRPASGSRVPWCSHVNEGSRERDEVWTYQYLERAQSHRHTDDIVGTFSSLYMRNHDRSIFRSAHVFALGHPNLVREHAGPVYRIETGPMVTRTRSNLSPASVSFLPPTSACLIRQSALFESAGIRTIALWVVTTNSSIA